MNRIKYCSQKCYWQSKIGKPAPNKGKKFPQWSLDKHWNWKGSAKDQHGYIMIKKPFHPRADHQGYVKLAILVMEKHLKRFLKPEEVVHHINHIKNDNRINNLKLFKNMSEHMKFHSTVRFAPAFSQ